MFQLQKTYVSGSQTYARTIVKPVAGTVKIAVNGILRVQTTDYTINTATGQITFNLPPASGLTVTAGCEFDVPVRFDTDRISTSVATYQAGQIPTVPVIEVRL